MSNNLIKELTSQQENSIQFYREKWSDIVISNQNFDRYQAKEAVKTAYELTGRSKPKIIFSDSTNSALKIFFNWLHAPYLFGYFGTKDQKKLSENLEEHIARQLPKQLMAELNKRFTNQIGYEVDKHLDIQMLSGIPSLQNLPHPNISELSAVLLTGIPGQLRCLRR